jgi:hypothetical protein
MVRIWDKNSSAFLSEIMRLQGFKRSVSGP